MNKRVYVFCAIAVIIIGIGGYYSYSWYFNYKYSFRAKLIATVPEDKLIDKALIELVKKYKGEWFCAKRNSGILKSVFEDIDLSLFPPDTTILIIYGRELDPDMNNEKFDSDDLTPREDQRYVGLKVIGSQSKNTFYLYTYNKKCMLAP